MRVFYVFQPFDFVQSRYFRIAVFNEHPSKDSNIFALSRVSAGRSVRDPNSTTTRTNASFGYYSSHLADMFVKLVMHVLAATLWWLILNFQNKYNRKRQTPNLPVNFSGLASVECGLRVFRDIHYKFTCGWSVLLQF